MSSVYCLGHAVSLAYARVSTYLFSNFTNMDSTMSSPNHKIVITVFLLNNKRRLCIIIIIILR